MRFHRIAAVLFALALSGCAGIQLPSLQSIETAVNLGTASVANPVTPERLEKAQQALVVVFIGLNTWKSACKNGSLLPASCRQQIATVQVYTRKLKPLLVELRAFVRDNDQVNAFVAFNTFSSLIATVKTQAAQNGIEIGSTP